MLASCFPVIAFVATPFLIVNQDPVAAPPGDDITDSVAADLEWVEGVMEGMGYDVSGFAQLPVRELTEEAQVRVEAMHRCPEPGSAAAVATFLEGALYGDLRTPDQEDLRALLDALRYRFAETPILPRDVLLATDAGGFFLSPLDGAIVSTNCLQVPWSSGGGRFFRQREQWKEMWDEDRSMGNWIEHTRLYCVPAAMAHWRGDTRRSHDGVDDYLLQCVLDEGETALVRIAVSAARENVVLSGLEGVFDQDVPYSWERVRDVFGMFCYDGMERRRIGSKYLYCQWRLGGWDAVRDAASRGSASALEVMYPEDAALFGDFEALDDRAVREVCERFDTSLKGGDEWYRGALGPVFYNELLSFSPATTDTPDLHMAGPLDELMSYGADHARLFVAPSGAYVLCAAIEFRSQAAARRFVDAFEPVTHLRMRAVDGIVRLVAAVGGEAAPYALLVGWPSSPSDK